MAEAHLARLGVLDLFVLPSISFSLRKSVALRATLNQIGLDAKHVRPSQLASGRHAWSSPPLASQLATVVESQLLPSPTFSTRVVVARQALFVDDSAAQRAEALAVLPGLRTMHPRLWAGMPAVCRSLLY